MENKIDFIELLSTLEKIKGEICQFIDLRLADLDLLNPKLKSDKTIVTDVDIFISNLIKKEILNIYPELNFYSEEDKGAFAYPMIILDPIDGTKELSQGVNECSVSFGIYFSKDLSDERNFSWIFNPFTRFCAHSEEKLLHSNKKTKRNLTGMVSNTEYEKGSFSNIESVNIIPKGSIAYKLALLSRGICDFVITTRPKNIWDIKAGAHLCFKSGVFTYIQGSKVESIGEELIEAPILWCKDEDISFLDSLFHN